MKRAKALWALPALAALAACYNGSAVVEQQSMSLDTPEWNLAHSDVGRITTAVDLGDDLVVYGDKGAFVVSGGVVSASDATVAAWNSATAIPASDGNGTWSVAADGQGRLLRIRNRSVLELVSDRYGLASVKVRALADAAGTGVAFALDDVPQVAFADGKTVQRYDLAVGNISATRWRLAGAASDGSVTSVKLDPNTATHDGMATRITMSDALATAFDGDKLVIESQHGLYAERTDGTFDLVLEDGDQFHGLAETPDGVWFGVGSRLCLYGGGALRCAEAGVGDTATLVGSARGVYAIENGTMRAFERHAVGAEALWRTSVRPVFARVCASCHALGGSSGIDLSGYVNWSARVDLIDTRVLQLKNMPANQQLPADDLATIATWVACQRTPSACPPP